jgi:hypothetical protein
VREVIDTRDFLPRAKWASNFGLISWTDQIDAQIRKLHHFENSDIAGQMKILLEALKRFGAAR